jgi:phosphatidylglycerol lysyltransferase
MAVARTFEAAAPIEMARRIVLQHGWNATSYQILNPGIRHWFSADKSAVVGYTRKQRVLLVAGAPVCSFSTLTAVCDEFEAFAADQRCRVCYVCAEERLKEVFAPSARHAAVALGAQPAWDPNTWPQILQKRPSLRAQLRRASNKGVVVEAVSMAQAAQDPELRRVLNEWLSGRPLPPLHFLVEPNVLDGVLQDRVILAASQNGKCVAFLVASPMPARNGYLVELLARSFAAPNGTSELLIDAAMRRLAGDGCTYVTLGLVALAQAADEEIHCNPGWLRTMMFMARAHANRFYNFQGLEQFRVKMWPNRWETVYAISDRPRFSLQTMYALGAAFSGISPWTAVALGLRKAVAEEVRRMVQRG